MKRPILDNQTHFLGLSSVPTVDMKLQILVILRSIKQISIVQLPKELKTTKHEITAEEY